MTLHLCDCQIQPGSRVPSLMFIDSADVPQSLPAVNQGLCQEQGPDSIWEASENRRPWALNSTSDTY